MLWIQRIALTLLAFGLAGVGLIAWQPSGQATTSRDTLNSYDLAITSGANLRLAETQAHPAEDPGLLSCKKVLNIGAISIGAHCVSHGRDVSIKN